MENILEETSNRFYVYSHIDNKGKCFNIGKGSGKRHKSKGGRNPHWHSIASKGFKSIILVNNIDEATAFRLEAEFIESIGYENLTNVRHEWGCGGWSRGEETKKKIGKARIEYLKHNKWEKPPHSDERKAASSKLWKQLWVDNREEMCANISKSKIGKGIGPKPNRVGKGCKKVLCLNNNKIYNSVKEAAEKLGLRKDGITKSASPKYSQQLTKGYGFKYI